MGSHTANLVLSLPEKKFENDQYLLKFWSYERWFLT